MKSLEESVVQAMDGSQEILFPFLPYILQDLWEMGSDPEMITDLIRRHSETRENAQVLDLGCGKGAVSVTAASTLGCTCYGIDGIPEFIADARKKAEEYGVNALCRFAVGDIREEVTHLSNFDVIILGSIGPVFGDYHETLSGLASCLSESGIVIIDDGYVEEDGDYSHPLILKRSAILHQVESAGMQLVEETILDADSIQRIDDHMYGNIEKRCHELIDTYPEKEQLFLEYLRDQKVENDVLENHVICSTMVIKRKP